MGIYSDWVVRNPEASDKQAVNVEFVLKMLDKVCLFPVGSYYTQYPAAKSNDFATAFPIAEQPSSLFGGTWEKMYENERVFFRTGGSFSAESDRISGKQEDAIRNITGVFGTHKSFDGNGQVFTGPFSFTSNGSQTPGTTGTAMGIKRILMQITELFLLTPWLGMQMVRIYTRQIG
jgi:hypothetical protein